MTSGRINQVATNRFLDTSAQQKPEHRNEVRKCVWNFDCVLASVSQLSCTTAPPQRLRPQVETPLEKRRRRKDGLCCTSTVEFNSCSELRRGVLPGACNCKSTVAKQPLIHTTPIQEHRSSRAGLTGTRC